MQRQVLERRKHGEHGSRKINYIILAVVVTRQMIVPNIHFHIRNIHAFGTKCSCQWPRYGISFILEIVGIDRVPLALTFLSYINQSDQPLLFVIIFPIYANNFSQGQQPKGHLILLNYLHIFLKGPTALQSKVIISLSRVYILFLLFLRHLTIRTPLTPHTAK